MIAFDSRITGAVVSGELPIGTTERVSVRFVDADDGALSVLEIENPRERDVFGDVRRELHAAGVEVMSIEVRLDQQRLIGRLHLRGFDGAPIDQQRHLEIQDRVLQAVLSDPWDNNTPVPKATAN